ncbi:5-amino-6-(5-phospho-D-ribitylamino)uracil phosphatase YigB [Serratia marcescens]|uniref:5-amino-6-(5-phospho-D-ribitylamino)uracil phosphatase YigB n=1 Tax=Serratia marcescens TaxID=615 RepID=UPI001F150E2F|nr:5-amino-6-(5-phospho-D-ribitylamino)uracil phosphatase YigB [Serratia marcescens]MDP8608122.1 5-amino-6-(5-phospho-D-ribitylamino)uracil phosphatase YigB [Serratia marcescens]MDP8613214.1 5-amino-6-(5-phospho-D-ribitylamino)uracil phosphatase YigB [Serratia marcescens]MDP8643268.1 5-amino-6-(5-phospho-D-ribitylamino)uracil phosphatase YigB [Serratia marcescens]MDP8653203.1 5-amino-6-(5-phospho-D-ribitylamino)uracil phosphatase YigB [Serratia marcescens]MDP8658166.1 5-amino-6-(5-phospho-D-ri
MHFYRPLRPLAALTFDLDDTLYDNRPVIRQTEQQSVAFLQSYHPGLNSFQSADFHRLRQELCEQDPEIYHDVTQWRWRAIHLALSRQGLRDADAAIGADAAMQNFALWRSRIEVPEATHATLKALAARYPLVAITNGNADPAQCGLDGYFQFVLRSGPDGRAKPYQDMYHLAVERLGVAPEQILHVGDDLTTDVAGALRAGLQACWINDRQRCLMQAADSRLLPHIEISQLASLTALL